MSKPRKKGVDMSLPEKDRGRRREQGSVGGTPSAQMSHASGSRAARWQRDGARKLAAMERLRGDAERFAAEVAELNPADLADRVMDRLADEAPYADCLIEDESEMNNLLMARRPSGQDR